MGVRISWLILARNAPLATLASLYILNIVRIGMRDLSPLVANVGLGAGDDVSISGNPLSYEAVHTQIPTLEARGVEINAGPLISVPYVDVELPGQSDDVYSHDFEEVSTDDTVVTTFTIRNEGMAELIIDGADLAGSDSPFTATQPAHPDGVTPWIIAPGATMTFDVAFTPTELGTASCTLTLTNNDVHEANYSILLNGTGTDGGQAPVTTSSDAPGSVVFAPLIPIVTPRLDDNVANDTDDDSIAATASTPAIDLFVESPDSYIPRPQPISVGFPRTTLYRAATAEYDLRPLGDDLSTGSDDYPSNGLGISFGDDNPFPDLLAESLVTIPL